MNRMRIAIWECCGSRHELMLSRNFPQREDYKFTCQHCGTKSPYANELAKWYVFTEKGGWRATSV